MLFVTVVFAAKDSDKQAEELRKEIKMDRNKPQEYQPTFMPTQATMGVSTLPSTGAKVGYFALGFLVNLIGVLIAWLISKDKGEATKSIALKFSLVGFVVALVLSIVLAAVAIFFTASFVSFM